MSDETEDSEASHWWIKEPMRLRVVNHVDDATEEMIPDTIVVTFASPTGNFGSPITLDSDGLGNHSKLTSITSTMVAGTKYTATFEGESLYRQVAKVAKVRGAR